MVSMMRSAPLTSHSLHTHILQGLKLTKSFYLTDGKHLSENALQPTYLIITHSDDTVQNVELYYVSSWTVLCCGVDDVIHTQMAAG